MADLSSDIETAATQPESATVDGSSVRARTIQEMIEADKYLKQNTAKGKNHLGLHFVKLIPNE